MSNVTTIIKLGASVLITIAAIAIAVVLFTQGQDVTKSSESDIKGIGQVLSERKYEAYNGTKVSGSNVINAIRMHAENGSLTVSVDTLAGVAVSYSTSVPYNVTATTDTAYINPVGTFRATLTRANGAVTGISFTQE